MNQTPPSSDNLFLRSYAAWRQRNVKLTGKLLMLALIPLGLLLIWILLGARVQLQQDAAAHADKIGTELARQVAASSADLLAANDQLSLNILLAQWVQNPLIAHTRLFNAENRVIAEAGSRPSASQLAPGMGQFNAAVHVQDNLAGQVQLSLAAAPFMAPASTLLKALSWAIAAFMLIAALLAWRTASSLRLTMQQLGTWQGDSPQPAPGIERRDELGDLARQLAARRIIDSPPPPVEEVAELATPAEDIEAVPATDADMHDTAPADPLDTLAYDLTEAREQAPADEQPLPTVEADDPVLEADGVSTPERDHQHEDDSEDAYQEVSATPNAPLETAVLAIRLGNQEALRRLPRPRLMALLERYRTQLEEACQLYNGHLHTLHDGTSLVTFNARECRQDELTHALCCGELLRILGHDLQVEIADTGITLHLHLAICHAPCLRALDDQALAEEPTCNTMLQQVQYSRNLLLLDSSLATCEALRERAVVRRLASQPGIYCIERLQDPYQSMLEQQLNHFYQQRQG